MPKSSTPCIGSDFSPCIVAVACLSPLGVLPENVPRGTRGYNCVSQIRDVQHCVPPSPPSNIVSQNAWFTFSLCLSHTSSVKNNELNRENPRYCSYAARNCDKLSKIVLVQDWLNTTASGVATTATAYKFATVPVAS